MAAALDRFRGDVHAAAAVVLFDLLLFAGAGGAALGWRPAAALMVTGVAGLIGAHLVIGVVGYRAVMRRPWPEVALLQDDDD